MEEIPISQPEFRALSSESRARILKILHERNHTLSELAARTGMAAPSVKQHMEILAGSGLVKLEDEGRKWKYYSLTRKGKAVLSSGKNPQANILIVLSSALGLALIGIMLVVAGTNFLQPQMQQATQAGNGVPTITQAPEPEKSIAAQTTQASTRATTGQNMNNTATANCQPLFQVQKSQVNGQLSPSEMYAQKCYGALTKEECAKLDFYSAATGSFGTGDGKADCVWKAE